MKIFMIGIGGIAMGNLAYMLKQIGHEVSGSDQNLYPPMSDKLLEWGMSPKSGFNSINVKDAELVIIGNAISRGNPEVEEVLNSGKEYMSMAQAIGQFFLKGKKPIVVSGTHGKTTTTFLIHYLLDQIGFSPSLFVGGIRKDGHPGFAIGKGEFFVIEGDEYDSAFFDKSSKFLHYRPYYLAINALDFDHADIFKDLEAIQISFQRLLKLVPSNGKVFAWKGSKNLSPLLKHYSLAPIHRFDLNTKESILKYKKGVLSLTSGEIIKPELIGAHNYRNAEVALQIALDIAPNKKKELVDALVSFPGVKRRQEKRKFYDRTVLVEDFAHHPVAIEETIKAHKEAYPGWKIISLFEPRSATSHRNVFQKDFAKAFTNSHYALVTEVFNISKVKGKDRLDVRKLVKEIPKYGKTKAYFSKNTDELLNQLQGILSKLNSEKIILLVMSNGAFGGIYQKLDAIVDARNP